MLNWIKVIWMITKKVSYSTNSWYFSGIWRIILQMFDWVKVIWMINLIFWFLVKLESKFSSSQLFFKMKCFLERIWIQLFLIPKHVGNCQELLNICQKCEMLTVGNRNSIVFNFQASGKLPSCQIFVEKNLCGKNLTLNLKNSNKTGNYHQL